MKIYIKKRDYKKSLTTNVIRLFKKLNIFYYNLPCSFASAKTAEIPFLFIFLIAAADTFSVTHLSSSGMKNFLVCRLG